MMKKALIDVDETLYDYATPLYETIKNNGINIKPPSEWNSWDYICPELIPVEKAMGYFKEVHKRQSEFKPYKEAQDFLTWASKKHHIVIASNRDTSGKDLELWLIKNKLKYDEVWVGADKTKIMENNGLGIVVDDNPSTLNKASELGIRSVGLSKPWNKNKVNNDVELYKTLREIWTK